MHWSTPLGKRRIGKACRKDTANLSYVADGDISKISITLERTDEKFPDDSAVYPVSQLYDRMPDLGPAQALRKLLEKTGGRMNGQLTNSRADFRRHSPQEI
jgi:hypothetical protein